MCNLQYRKQRRIYVNYKALMVQIDLDFLIVKVNVEGDFFLLTIVHVFFLSIYYSIYL